MAYLLNGSSIKAPQRMSEENDTQHAEVRTMSGSRGVDMFGSNKRVWTLEYSNIQKADFDTINTLYQLYLSTGAALSWEVTETNYTVSATTVHVFLQERGFTVRSESYLSNFTLVLREA